MRTHKLSRYSALAGTVTGIALSASLLGVPSLALGADSAQPATAATAAAESAAELASGTSGTKPAAENVAPALAPAAPAQKATGVSLSATKIKLGEFVVITPVGGSTAQTYNYVWDWENRWTNWSSTVKETGKTTSDLSSTFTPTQAGNYTIYLDAVNADGSKTTFSARLEVAHAADFQGVLLSETSIAGGKSVEVKPSISGDTTGLVYSYAYARKGGQKQVAQADSQNASWTFNPTEVGTYTIYVSVKHPDGQVETKQTSLSVTEPVLNVRPVAQMDGTTLKVSIQGSLPQGTTFNYVWLRNYDWSEWDSTIKRAGSATSDKTSSFTNLKSGNYTVFIDCILPNGFKKTLSTTLVAKRTWNASGVVTNLQSPQVKHTKITWRVPVSGARANRLKFNYVWARDNWADWWSNKKSGDATSATSWTFEPNHSGHYALYVDVIDIDTGETQTYQKYFYVSRGWDATRINLSFSSGAKLLPNSTATARAQVTGNTRGLTYNYVWDLNSWANWSSTIKETGNRTTATSRTWTVYALGSYGFYIDVVDPDGETVTLTSPRVLCVDYRRLRNNVISTLVSEHGHQRPWLYMNNLLSKGGKLCWGSTNAWCATFVWWGFNQNNLNQYWCGGQPLSEPAQIRDWYRARGRYSRSMRGIQPGDIIFMSYWVRMGEPVTHVVYCAGVRGNTITIVGSNPDWYKDMSANDAHFWGYARPEWGVM